MATITPKSILCQCSKNEEYLQNRETMPVQIPLNIKHKRSKSKVVFNKKNSLNCLFTSEEKLPELNPTSTIIPDSEEYIKPDRNLIHNLNSKSQSIIRSFNFEILAKQKKRYKIGKQQIASLTGSPRLNEKLDNTGSLKNKNVIEEIKRSISEKRNKEKYAVKRTQSNFLFKSMGRNLGRLIKENPLSSFATYDLGADLPPLDAIPSMTQNITQQLPPKKFNLIVNQYIEQNMRTSTPIKPELGIYIPQVLDNPQISQTIQNKSEYIPDPNANQTIPIEIVQKISEIESTDKDTIFYKPSILRITKALQALPLFFKVENPQLENYLKKIITEIERAIFVKEGALSEMLNNKTLISKYLKELETFNIKNIPYFTVVNDLIEAFEYYISKNKKSEIDLKATIKGLEANLKDKTKVLKKIELNLLDLRKTNRNPIFHQYMLLSEKNAELNKELGTVKYKLSYIEEENSRNTHNLKDGEKSNFLLKMHTKQLTSELNELSLKMGNINKKITRMEYEKLESINEYEIWAKSNECFIERMRNLEYALSKVQEENAQLNIDLKDLTPRFQSFPEVFYLLGLENPKKDQEKNISSEEYITALIINTKNLLSKDPITQIKLEKRHPSVKLPSTKFKSASKLFMQNIFATRRKTTAIASKLPLNQFAAATPFKLNQHILTQNTQFIDLNNPHFITNINEKYNPNIKLHE